MVDGDRKVARGMWVNCDGFVPYAGDEQANVSPTATGRLDTLDVFFSTLASSRKADTVRVVHTDGLFFFLADSFKECCEVKDEVEVARKTGFFGSR